MRPVARQVKLESGNVMPAELDHHYTKRAQAISYWGTEQVEQPTEDNRNQMVLKEPVVGKPFELRTEFMNDSISVKDLWKA